MTLSSWLELTGGGSLAWAEMKLTLTKMIWHFDMELADFKGDWADQRVFMLYEKTPLNVRLSPRV